MNAELLKNLIIVITIAIAFLKVVLNELDVMASRKALVGKPAAEITKAVEYTATKRRFETTTTIISFSYGAGSICAWHTRFDLSDICY